MLMKVHFNLIVYEHGKNSIIKSDDLQKPSKTLLDEFCYYKISSKFILYNPETACYNNKFTQPSALALNGFLRD
jgi:hypothetical protein